MSKQEEPLNEMSLNTPAGKLNTSMSQTKQRPTKGNKVRVEGAKALSERLSELLKDKKSVIRHKAVINRCLSDLYRDLRSTHMVCSLKTLSKQHLVFIVNLFNCDDATGASLETLHLYNETNPFPVVDLHGILLADYTFCNNGYLSTLKILAMQAILKLKSYNDYEKTLLQLFSHDERYLLKDTNLKIHTLIKIILHFYSVFSSSKVLFGLKFLQYMKRYNLKVESYIKNMGDGEALFERQLVHHAPVQSSINYRMFLDSFYLQYSKFKQTPEKIMLTDILPKSRTFNFKDENDLLSATNERTCDTLWAKIFETTSEDLIVIASRALQDADPLNVLKSLLPIYEVLRHEKWRAIRAKMSLLDKSLVFINSHLIQFNTCKHEVFNSLEFFYDYCIDNQEFTRLTNVINTVFNCSVVLEDFEFLKLAARLEVSRYYISKDSRLVRLMLKRFEKFVSSCSSFKQKLDIFACVFNVFFTMNELTFSSLQQFCQTIFGSILGKLKLQAYVHFNQCSEVMLAFLYANAPSLNVPIRSWHPITRMLYSCLSGIFDLNSTEINPDSNKWHMLYKYEVLIKTAYCFNLEMSKHSNLNLASITKSYSDKWINRAPQCNEPVSSFETEMIKMLLQYLKFNNFDKLVIDLIKVLKSRGNLYDCITPEADFYLCSALMELKMIGVTEMVKDNILDITADLKTLKLEPLLHILRSRIRIFVWEKDCISFDNLFVHQLPIIRKELFDVDNNTKMPVSKYLKVLLFNIELLQGASKLHISKNRIVNGVIEAKKALKLSVCLLNKIDKISQSSRLTLISLLALTYMDLIKTYIHVGIAKDCEYYVKEISKVICELREPTAVFSCLNFLYEYYQFTDQSDLASTVLRKCNRTFDFIDGESNIWGLTLFLYDNGEYEKLSESLKIFFNGDLSKTFLLKYWRLKMGCAIDDVECPPEYKPQNEINKLNLNYQRLMSQLESDPFFRSMFDSIIAAPSCQHPVIDTKHALVTPHKFRLTANVNASPRSSSMTPRGKHIKQKFERAAAINNLENLKKSIEGMKLEFLKNHELSQVALVFSLTLFLLSSICPTKISDANLMKKVVLSDLSRYMPLYYDKNLNTISSEIYANFDLLPMEAVESVSIEREKLLGIQESFYKCPSAFNVISIDVCPANESLLLSKIESKSGRKLHLRIPLNRAHSRDLDSHKLSFEEARVELSSIIKESNATTSVEVTNAIKTKGERRVWWETRYELDRRLELLLTNIEHYWFSGLKGIFNPVTIKPDLLKEFGLKLNEILHQNLPSRKQYANPSMFIQLDNWIVELILKLNPQDENFASMMEDLLYFILDIFLFQGEENAYDEIDFGGLHFQLEEQIRTFRAQLCDSDKVVHTFLVVGGACHMFPWECLPFMKSISVSRVPSYGSLDDLLKKYAYNLFPEVSLSSRISMILNPHGDLTRTESRFLCKFSKIAQDKVESKLLANCKPDEQTFLSMLNLSNVFVYLGHGGGEQYARLKEIKKCDHIAPSFLLGCSSASMKYFQNLESSGTVYAYLLGGCPLVLGNLWDVTDKDIDNFSEILFNKIKFFDDCHIVEKKVSSSEKAEDNASFALCVSSSRDVCHLKYLNGAAPVIYGLPMKFV